MPVRSALPICVCLAAALTACGSDAKPAAAPPIPTSTTVPSVSTTVPVETSAPTSSTVAVPVGLIEDCVDFVQYGVVIGNSLLIGLWNDAGQDVSALRSNCEALALTDPVGLQSLSTQWIDIKAYIAGSETTQAP